MKIHQLSVNYLAEQDRILVRINTSGAQEIRIWLTRRLMLGLWPLLSKILTKHMLQLEAAGTLLDTADEELKKMLTDFRKEEFLKQADFDTPYQERSVTLPLGEEPLLVTDVDAAPLPSGRLRLTFHEKPPSEDKPRNFQLELDPKLMQGLMHLLEQALARSQWREPLGGPVSAGSAPAAEEDAQATQKPRYLN
jgi:hypothetical protein